jgi:hypothetical protein
MRSGRSLIILLLIAGGLGGYIYFVEMQRDPMADAESTREKVFTLTPGAIEQVEVTNAAAETTALARTDGNWVITAPARTEADTVEVSTVVSSIESLEQTRVVAEAPDSAAPFGLEPARMTIAFQTADDTTPRRLLIGNKTPTGGDLYAKVEGSSKVFLIGGYLEDTFNKSTFDFRDKSVLKFARDAADSVAIVEGNTRMAFAKSGSDWRLTAPIAARADFSAVDGLISRLFQARMGELVTADGSGSLRDYGLDRPQMTVTVGSGSSQAQLAIGKAQNETNVYARDLSRPLVFTVEQSLVDELKKKPEDVRVKDVFAFRSFNATGFDITVDGTNYSFARTKGEGDNAADVWSMSLPTAKTVDATKMSDMLTTASNLRAESFATSAFSSGDTVTMTARFGDANNPQTETVTFRKSGDVVHAIRDGEPGAAVVSTIDFDRVLTLLREITS